MIIFICIGIGISIHQYNTMYPTTNNNNNNDSWMMVGGITSSSATFRIGWNNVVVPTTSDGLFIIATDPNYNNIIFQQSLANIIMNNDTTIAISSNQTMNDQGDVVKSQLIRVVNITEGNNPTTTTPPTTMIVAFQIEGLSEQTIYYYRLGNDDSTTQGTFITPAPMGMRYNFSILTAGCAHTGSNHPIFTYMSQEHHLNDTNLPILMMLHLGDFHYADIYTDNIMSRIEAIQAVVSSSSRQRALYQSMAIANMWDDHDFMGNDSGNRTNKKDDNISTTAYDIALQSFQIVYPHYPLASLMMNTSNNDVGTSYNNSPSLPYAIMTDDPIPNVSPYHAYTIGTIRFIITDLRSECNTESMYSPQQKQWFYEELSNSYLYDYVIWISTKPWIGPSVDHDDAWFGHPTDRAELSYHISHRMKKRNLFVISADAHMIAFDNGSNTYYGNEYTNSSRSSSILEDATTTTISSFPILQSGSMDRIGSIKGGPFSDNCYTFTSERTNQYSKVSFNFPNETITTNDNSGSSNTNGNISSLPCIYIESYRVNGRHMKETLMTQTLCGTDIFHTTNITTTNTTTNQDDTVGTCTGQSFETSSSIMLYISIAITILSFVLLHYMYCVNITPTILSPKEEETNNHNTNNDNNDSQDNTNTAHGDDGTTTTTTLRRRRWLFIAWIVLFGYVIMIMIAIGIPFAKNTPVFTLRPFAILGITQSIIIAVLVMILVMIQRNYHQNMQLPQQQHEEEE